MNKLKLYKSLLLFFVVIAIFVFGLFSYSNSLIKNVQNSAHDTMKELSHQQVFNINLKLEKDASFIKSMAQALAYVDKIKLSDTSFLASLQRNTSFSYLSYAQVNGYMQNSNGQVIDVSDREYFKRALLGQTVVSVPMVSRYDNQSTVIPIATPIYSGTKVTSVLVGVYNVENLKSMILPSYNGDGFAYITDAEGKIIIEPENQNSIFTHKYGFNNMFDGFASCKFISGDEPETIRLNMQSGLSGHSLVKIDGQKRYSHYSPLDFNGWYLFMIVPEQAVMRQAQSVIQEAIVLAASVVLVIICFLILIFYMRRRSDKERKEYTLKLENIAYYDEITNAPTLYYFKELALKELSQNANCKAALLKLDITNFKLINDIYGFDTGNLVLKAVKESVDEVAKSFNFNNIFCTRINADEFVVFDAHCESVENCTKRWNTFLEIFKPRINSIIKHWRFEFSIGRYFFDQDEHDIVKALEKVNLAHRTAKKKAISGFCDYDSSLRNDFLEKIDIENKMHDALKNKEFKLYLQPKYNIVNETIAGAEALVRWQLSSGEIVPPSKFIHIFESNGFITQLDFYMFEATCQQINRWIKDGITPIPVSVNFSRLHLTNPDFVLQLVAITNKYQVEHKLLEIELTESVFFDNAIIIENLLHDLRNEGFSLSIDDFGTGYSSLGLLKDLSVDIIKIDQSFFANNKYEKRSKIVIESVIQMAKKLGIFTIAEGVETEEHVNLLRDVGCDLVQGYYYAKPQPAETLILD